MKPSFVTLTGIDDATDLDRVADLSARYPVEWGVLVSRKRSGNDPRYPSLDLLPKLRGRGLRLAMHLCGSWATKAFDEGVVDPDLVEVAYGLFDRVQFNVSHGERAVIAHEDGSFDAMECLNATARIVQCRGDAFPAYDEFQVVDWLFDRSGGTGEAPRSWPTVPEGHDSVGYAGGIGPENVLEVLDAIARTHPEGLSFSIDMESRIRTDDRLDLQKCEAVLRAVYGG